MSVLRPLESAEILCNKDGKHKVTHEIFTYTILPYANPPMIIGVLKGLFDIKGQFQVFPESQKNIEITPDGFRTLLSPNAQGKPALDFRLSDALSLVRPRAAGSAKSVS